MKKYPRILALCVVAGALALSCGRKAEDTAPPIPRDAAKDPIDATYIIDGREIELVDGMAQGEIAPGSAEKARTRIMGKPAYGFLDEDSVADALVILVDDRGGSGTFYYMAAAIGRKAGESRRTEIEIRSHA